jgi:hypothetical protein
MNFKRLICGSAIALAIGASVLTAGSGVTAAQPGPAPCQFGDCQGPGGPGGSGGHDQGPRRLGTTRDTRPAARVDRVDPVDRVPLLAARRRGTTTPPGGHRRPIRAGAASMTAGAITSRSATTGAG